MIQIQEITEWLRLSAELLVFAGVAYNTVQNCQASRKIKKVSSGMTTVQATAADTNAKVAEVVIATNGMRDALVVSARKEGFAQGQIVGAATKSDETGKG